MNLFEVLAKHGLASPAVVAALREAAAQTGWAAAALAIKAGLVEPQMLADLLSRELQVRKVDLDKEKPDAATVMSVPARVAHQLRVVPTWLREERTGDSLYLAMLDPSDPAPFEALAGLRVRFIPFVASDQQIERALARMYPGHSPDPLPQKVLQQIARARDGFAAGVPEDPTERGFLTTSADEEQMQRVPQPQGAAAAPASNADLDWLLQRQQEAGLGRSKSVPAPVTGAGQPAYTPMAMPATMPAPGAPSAFAPPPVTLSDAPPAQPVAGAVGRGPIALNLVLVGKAQQRARVRAVLAGWFTSLQESDNFKAALGLAMTEHVDVFVLLDPASDAEGVKLLASFLKRMKRPRVIADGDDAGLAVDARLGKSMNELELSAKIVRALAHG